MRKWLITIIFLSIPSLCFSGGIDSYVKLALHCNGSDTSTTFTDASSAAHGNATVNGAAQVDTAKSKFGGASALFDGTTDALSYADHADWDLPGDFTIDCWVAWAAISLSYPVCRGGEQYAILLHAGSLRWRINAGEVITAVFVPTLNQWYHIAVVRSGSTNTLYIDGTSVGTASDSTSLDFATSLIIGADGYGSFGGSLNGWIDEWRLSKGIARWTANFTPETSEYSADAASSKLMLLGVG